MIPADAEGPTDTPGYELAVICDYDPAWPRRFACEAALIRGALGVTVLGLHQVGSTAIPGMPAKAVIELCLEGAHEHPGAADLSDLGELGYQHLGACGVAGRHFFRKGTPRSFHLHWCPLDGAVARSQLRFREILRGSPALARRYAELKRTLSGRYGIDDAAYVDAKQPLIREILGGG